MVIEKHLFFDIAVFKTVLARAWPTLVSGAILVILFGAVAIRADGPNQVGLVVVHGDGDIVTRCIEFDEEKISGYDVLDRSGLDLNIEPSGMGATVCRIDNEGCTFPQDPCFCQCTHWLTSSVRFLLTCLSLKRLQVVFFVQLTDVARANQRKHFFRLLHKEYQVVYRVQPFFRFH